ncbi:MAG: hypothetical protein HFJ84_00185 [Clostridiales bacterium]|jgi:uncharacterized membrane protein|nr:hypothetical protein [Clostridiales bacterium]
MNQQYTTPNPTPSGSSTPPNPPQPPKWEPPVYRSQQAPNSKVYWILCYLGILWLVGLIADRENPKTRFHVNQGIILSMLGAVLSVAYTIWHVIMNAVFGLWFLGGLIGVHPIGAALNTAFGLAVAAIMVFYVVVGIMNAVNCREKPLPIIGKLFVIVK